MSKVTKIRYFTPDKVALINPENIKLYDKYLKSNIIKNKDVESTTYKVYRNNMQQFMVYLAEEWDNIGLYDEEFFEESVDIMEGFIDFCVSILQNNKKAVNNKLSAVSSFYNWSRKRKLIKMHPFEGQLERMKGAQDEKIIASHYLTQDEINEISKGLEGNPKYDIQDKLIWHIMIDSCNRVGAISKLTLSSLNLEEMFFEDIREKRGYKVEVAFEEYSAELIKEWLEMRKEMDDCQVDALFITKLNDEYRQMAKATIQNRIKRIGEIIGLTDFRSHSIRKTAINQIYEQTGNLDLAAEMANHSSVETTRQSYIKPKTKSETRQKIAELKKKKKVEENKASE